MEEALFEASHPFGLFDYFRVPYQIRPPLSHDRVSGLPVHRLTCAGQSRSLLWLASNSVPAGRTAALRLGRYRLREWTFFGHVALGTAAPALLRDVDRGWEPAEEIFDAGDRHIASVWRDREGNIFLPFDPGEMMWRFWSESYLAVGRSPLRGAAHSAAVRGYYLARPAIPRPVQIRARRLFTNVQSRSSFPAWPTEDSLHSLYAWLLALIAELAGHPIPYVGPWPDGRNWALVLTHDVETAAGYRDMELLRSLERERGYRSSWNFVGERYPVEDGILRTLRDEGCEVGVHGLRHDGRDLGSRRLMERRLPAIREFAKRWDAIGFRSPATQRDWELMPRLGFSYDSSYTDTDPYEPQPGGCCTYWPYFNRAMVELPITLPQDYTVFFLLQHSGPGIWLEKAKFLRDRQGMALLLTHPDYAHNPRVADGYRTLLEEFQHDDTAWRTVPREVAAWWRDRNASTIGRAGSAWRVEGPAAGRARVCLAYPATSAPGQGCAEMVTRNPARSELDGQPPLNAPVVLRSVGRFPKLGFPSIRRSRAPPLGVVTHRQARVSRLRAAREASVMALRLLASVPEVTFADALVARLPHRAAGPGSFVSLPRPEPR